MMIHKYTTHVDYKWLLKRLDTQLNESTNQNSINDPMSPSSLVKYTITQVL